MKLTGASSSPPPCESRALSGYGDQLVINFVLATIVLHDATPL
jgi:hypothetical protein